MAKDTEQIILETARKHFVQYGYAATRTQDIAEEAGVTKAMLHYYFRTKEKLYNQILVSILDYVVPKLAGVMAKQGEFWPHLERILDTYFEMLMANPDIPFFIMTELSQRKGDILIAELQKRASFFPAGLVFLQKMQQEMDAGRIKSIPPIQLILNILGMTVFPFIVRPIFSTIFNYSDEAYQKMMLERKGIVLDFVKNALRVG